MNIKAYHLLPAQPRDEGQGGGGGRHPCYGRGAGTKRQCAVYGHECWVMLLAKGVRRLPAQRDCQVKVRKRQEGQQKPTPVDLLIQCMNRAFTGVLRSEARLLKRSY